MPWLDEELEEWEDLSERERERIRRLLRDLGEEVDEDDGFE